jgi:hypothetical protein
METLHVWAWRLALVVSLVVALLSVVSGVSFLQVVLRAILGFAIIYGLSESSLYLFEKTSISEPKIGALLDIAVGQEGELSLDSPEQGEDAFGTSNGPTGYPSGRIGQSPIPGQVNQELTQGLPREEKQAEIVRRIGWGE